MIPKLLQASEWKHRHTGLTAISLVGEGCHNFLLPHLENVIKYALPAVGSMQPAHHLLLPQQ